MWEGSERSARESIRRPLKEMTGVAVASPPSLDINCTRKERVAAESTVEPVDVLRFRESA